jgi:AcrR family transcriptional regulator
MRQAQSSPATVAAARSPKAERTRQAILASARRAFAQWGYDGAGVRGIAEGAGVTAMMVNRYFGSKEGLFAEVVADTMRRPVILSAENLSATDKSHAFASALVGLTDTTGSPLDGFLILFRSTSSTTAARIAREQIEAAHHATATAAVTADHAAERAAVLLSLVAGIQMMRQMLQLRALADADRDTLIDILRPVIDQILTGAHRT